MKIVLLLMCNDNNVKNYKFKNEDCIIINA